MIGMRKMVKVLHLPYKLVPWLCRVTPHRTALPSKDRLGGSIADFALRDRAATSSTGVVEGSPQSAHLLQSKIRIRLHKANPEGTLTNLCSAAKPLGSFY